MNTRTRLSPTLTHKISPEITQAIRNTDLICGVDEAGRGPLAGPVVAAAVILPAHTNIDGVRDSKKLNAIQRETLRTQIEQTALSFAIGIANVEEIDTINILQATLLAMQRAIHALSLKPQLILVDGNKTPAINDTPIHAIVKGDDSVAVISAASILAKTYRDALMQKMDKEFPQYGFSRHKGYGTAYHLAQLREHGYCPMHRTSFAPISSMPKTQFP